MYKSLQVSLKFTLCCWDCFFSRGLSFGGLGERRRTDGLRLNLVKTNKNTGHSRAGLQLEKEMQVCQERILPPYPLQSLASVIVEMFDHSLL